MSPYTYKYVTHIFNSDFVLVSRSNLLIIGLRLTQMPTLITMMKYPMMTVMSAGLLMVTLSEEGFAIAPLLPEYTLPTCSFASNKALKKSPQFCYQCDQTATRKGILYL